MSCGNLGPQTSDIMNVQMKFAREYRNQRLRRNGKLIPVDEMGMFVAFVALVEGSNFVEVVASDLVGNQKSVLLVAHYVPPTEGIPLYLVWPPDELDVGVGRISVIGATWPDAVVSVNGVVATVNVESADFTDPNRILFAVVVRAVGRYRHEGADNRIVVALPNQLFLKS